jgi:hypothetical protein
MQHTEFADRSEDLAAHIRSALLLSESRLFSSALAVTRTALEHHLLDRLLLLADRYEETIGPDDITLIEQWEREFADKRAPWTADVTSITRTSNGRALKVVRRGHAVKNRDDALRMASTTRTGADRYFERARRSPGTPTRTTRLGGGSTRSTGWCGRSTTGARSLGCRKRSWLVGRSWRQRAVRRLFSVDSPNPTIGTLTALADALGLELVPRRRRAG